MKAKVFFTQIYICSLDQADFLRHFLGQAEVGPFFLKYVVLSKFRYRMPFLMFFHRNKIKIQLSSGSLIKTPRCVGLVVIDGLLKAKTPFK